MANVLKSLKEKFPDLYYLLLENQKKSNLIFFGPSTQLYARDSLTDKSFYYNHIFQKSRFDPNLYTNFYGKVLKSINDKGFQTYLGWSLDMTFNVIESNYNDDGLFFFQTDGICIEEASRTEKITTDKQSFPLKRCSNSTEYLKYYAQYDLPKYSYFQKGIKSMKSFIFLIENNYLLLKGNEEYFSYIFREKIPKFISAFEIIFKNNTNIAREYVDSYIFLNLYDKIMNKLDSFYSKEQKDLKLKIDENVDKYGIIELNLDTSLLKCNFTETFNSFEKLKDTKTSFEKTNSLLEINSIMMEEVKTVYENENGKKLEIQGDLLLGCWTYILAHYIQMYDASSIYLDYLFFKYFKIGKGYEKNDYIIQNFVGSMELLQNELLNSEKTIEEKPSTTPIKIVSIV